MGKEKRKKFPAIWKCDTKGREGQVVAADLDGTLLVGRSSFPYFMLVAMEAGGILRGLLLLLTSPMILFLYRLISESAGIHLMIFVALSGLRIGDIEAAAAVVLPRFYATDVRADSWRVFRACTRRRVVVTANPTVMVEPFVKGWLGGDVVLGTELMVNRWTGRATGFVGGVGVLVAERKRDALRREFAGDKMPEIGLGDRDTDHDFMALCKEGYMVPPNRRAERVAPDQLRGPATIFSASRFSRRPNPQTALLIFLWVPLGFLLSLLRLLLPYVVPRYFLRQCYRLTGFNITVRGNPPPRPVGSQRRLLVCNRRTTLDPVAVSSALGRAVSSVADYSAQLRGGDVIFFAEESSTFLPKVGDRILPVAINAQGELFNGRRGFVDLVFYLMNPRPVYEVTFLDELPEKWAGEGASSAKEVVGRVQQLLAKTLDVQLSQVPHLKKS
ncbi:glycerol-3-phosphate 2-O-acyltransferase 4-like [Wolffia australiana]